MSVALEFVIAPEGFQLGQVLSGVPDMTFELERVVPTGQAVMPLVWATGDDHAALQRSARGDPTVESMVALERIDDRGLYRVEWAEPPADLTEAIAAFDGSVLEARGDDDWQFRVRFEDHDSLSAFYDDVLDRGIDLRVDRTYTLSGATGNGHRLDLTVAQREALVLALRRGYFATPREANLGDLAPELGITRQSLSDRIRRANEKVLQAALLSTDGVGHT
ncbi:bacterio-opsin activator [Halobacteriales archaeon QH_7_68_42]|nr:MAG: bacterio-opsin activator [Halobacteriales archaeon QH_7_68_42]